MTKGVQGIEEHLESEYSWDSVLAVACISCVVLLSPFYLFQSYSPHLCHRADSSVPAFYFTVRS